MWMFVMMVCLLDQNQASPLPWEHRSLQLILQQQLDQTSPSPTPDVGQQRTSSSSSSSSSVSSESSQSSESFELLQAPSNSNDSLWLSELVLLGQRASERAGDRETGDDSVGSTERHRALLLTFHRLLSPPRLGGRGPGLAAGVGGATAEGGVKGVVGVVEEGGNKREDMDPVFPRPADRLTFDVPDHAHHHDYHGNEAGLELGL
ncbi:uncharacterized protein LOC143317409 [Chaetodon auriga]|uniref:uncharacterized protein LOC143317409 n=1 Tax=Chaetodon auriga TaxID=39042 RepID=UPI0040328B80